MSFKSEARHYFEVYKKFVSTSSAVAMSFRTSFILMVMMDFVFFASAFFTVDFIFNHVDEIAGWKRSQFMLFLSFMIMMDTLHMIIFSHNFWRFSDDLKTGQLDYTILRPLNSIFSVFFRYFKPSSVINLIPAIGVFCHFGLENGFTLLHWLLSPILLLLSLTLLVLIEFIISCSMFWLIEGLGINFLRMQMQQLARWPDIIYGTLTRKAFTFFIPVLLIGSAPAHFLLDTSRWYYIVWMVLAIIVSTLILRVLWSKGLKQYESASS